ncbi:hypothetical protein Nepgr_023971 [Nepenthes gracilis]|uniref:Uncharacterized protein n=1 Tax=Nepenthes gracilis TaxID=150966 RepID=A0AAD3T1Z2_NEPGR|nr:hypothetical protein Nepgr_023971 [Nepenthes gracilis]
MGAVHPENDSSLISGAAGVKASLLKMECREVGKYLVVDALAPTLILSPMPRHLMLCGIVLLGCATKHSGLYIFGDLVIKGIFAVLRLLLLLFGRIGWLLCDSQSGLLACFNLPN